jgi:hypothetical protein
MFRTDFALIRVLHDETKIHREPLIRLCSDEGTGGMCGNALNLVRQTERAGPDWIIVGQTRGIPYTIH